MERQEDQNEATRWQKIRTQLKKMLFPLVLVPLEVIIFALFAVLVKYDESGAPHNPNAESISNGSEDGSNGSDGRQDGGTGMSLSANTTKLYPFFQDVHVMIFIGFGFLMTFLRRYGYSSIAFNMLVASFAIQWSTITSGVFQFVDQATSNESDCCTIKVGMETLVVSDFAAAAVLITMGAVLGRATPFQLIIITFFELMFYSANEAINIFVFQAADIGGSMIIHTFGAYFGLGVSFMLYNKEATDDKRNSKVYHSDLFTMIGTLFLWLFWPSFNGGLASGNAQVRAIINTYFSMTGSVVTTFFFSMVFSKKKKLDMTHIQNATLAGGVAVGSVANMVIQPWGALLIGFLAGFISVVGYKFISPFLESLRWIYLQDTCGVHNLHGLPGVFSGLASAIAAVVAEEVGGGGLTTYGNSLFVVFPARAPSNLTQLTPEQVQMGIGTGEGRNAWTQAGFQLALLGVTLAVSIFGGLLTGLIVRWLPTPDEDLFDDKPYWKLAKDANNYLPDDDKKHKNNDNDKKPNRKQPKETNLRHRNTPDSQVTAV